LLDAIVPPFVVALVQSMRMFPGGLCSLLPVFWAYGSQYVIADQLWSTLVSLSDASIVRAISRLAGVSDVDPGSMKPATKSLTFTVHPSLPSSEDRS
jgi:hypothetical protein